ncbi:MAG: hypothetical protein HQM09_18060 [Candidatus Riflebacteria bacterium]|nr:hypothetical protein [Candidatus Riflebacteria bacterium]
MRQFRDQEAYRAFQNALSINASNKTAGTYVALFNEYGVYSDNPRVFLNSMERRLLVDNPVDNTIVSGEEIAIKNSHRVFRRKDILGVSTVGYRVFDRFNPPWFNAIVLIVEGFGNVPVSRFREDNPDLAAKEAASLSEWLGVRFVACGPETYPGVLDSPGGRLIVPLMVEPDDPPFNHR